jgi:hypothetical protein
MEKDLFSTYYKRAEKHLRYYMVSQITPHIIDVTASVMMCRDGYRPGGSTVEAICNNDLHGAVARADREVMANLQVIVAAYKYAHIEQLDYV